MRGKAFASIFAIPLCALLMSAAYPTSYSNIYQDTVNGSKIFDVRQTYSPKTDKKNGTAMDLTFTFELYEMNKTSVSTAKYTMYSFVSKLEIRLYDNVEYPNGLFDWFTGKRNASLAGNEIRQNYKIEGTTNYRFVHDIYDTYEEIAQEDGFPMYYNNFKEASENSMQMLNTGYGRYYICRQIYEPITILYNDNPSTSPTYDIRLYNWDIGINTGGDPASSTGRHFITKFRNSLPTGSAAGLIELYDSFSFVSDTKPTSLTYMISAKDNIPFGGGNVGDKYSMPLLKSFTFNI